MAKMLNGFWIFSTEQGGYKKSQVDECIASVYGEYEKQFNENARLKKINKELKMKLKNEKEKSVS